MCRPALVVLPLFLLGPLPSLHSQGKKQPSPDTATVEVAGKNLEHWIKLITSKDQSKSESAIRMVCLFSPDRAYQALPAILDRLKKHNPSARLKVDLSVRANGVIA